MTLSAKSASSVGEFRDSLHERMRNLAATQKFLRRDTRENINLHDLLQADMAHYLNLEGANVIIKGVSLALCRGV